MYNDALANRIDRRFSFGISFASDMIQIVNEMAGIEISANKPHISLLSSVPLCDASNASAYARGPHATLTAKERRAENNSGSRTPGVA